MTLEITELNALRTAVSSWKAAGSRVALVPTMGALHAGHLALVEAAKKHAERVAVSIFVNPTQFGPNEDFSRYPRTVAEDVLALRSVGADAVWLPTVETMYPEGFATTIHVRGIADILEGEFRPGHFNGVATVVAKLLLQVRPDVALFGEKDYQQLCLIKRLVNDLDIKTSIIGIQTQREADGLAMSSRNRYLSAAERMVAPALHRIIHEAAIHIQSGNAVARVLDVAREDIREAGFSGIDYLALHAEESLAALTHYAPPARLLAAVHLGTTRLIDNVRVG